MFINFKLVYLRSELFIRYPAQGGHYETDAKTFAEWGIDSLKFDSCNEDPKRFDTLVPQMEKALNATGLKNIIFIIL